MYCHIYQFILIMISRGMKNLVNIENAVHRLQAHLSTRNHSQARQIIIRPWVYISQANNFGQIIHNSEIEYHYGVYKCV